MGKAPVVVEGGAAAVQLDGPCEAHHRLPELPLWAMREGRGWRGWGGKEQCTGVSKQRGTGGRWRVKTAPTGNKLQGAKEEEKWRASFQSAAAGITEVGWSSGCAWGPAHRRGLAGSKQTFPLMRSRLGKSHCAYRHCPCVRFIHGDPGGGGGQPTFSKKERPRQLWAMGLRSSRSTAQWRSSTDPSSRPSSRSVLPLRKGAMSSHSVRRGTATCSVPDGGKIDGTMLNRTFAPIKWAGIAVLRAVTRCRGANGGDRW